MENQFVWKDEFNIGVDIIDKEHKKLFKIINKLFEFKEEDSTRQWACREGIKFFKQHAADHFADEEAYTCIAPVPPAFSRWQSVHAWQKYRE